MAQPTKKAPEPLYRDKTTRYISRNAYRTKIGFADTGFPTPEPVELLTLKFEGQHPDNENTIVVSGSDFRQNFEAYDPIKTTTATAAKLTAIIAIFAALLFPSCGDKETMPHFPKDARQIEGFWKRENGHETTFYFSNGKATLDTWVGQTVVSHSEYLYTTHGDTVRMLSYPGGAKKADWLVYFFDAKRVHVATPLDAPAMVFTLKRL